MLKHSSFHSSILLCAAVFLSADKDPAGGSATDAEPKTLADAKAALTKAQADAKSAKDALAAVEKERDDAKATATDAKAAADKVAGQFAELEKTAAQTAKDLATAQATIKQTALERDAAQGKLVTAEQNITRLESLCGVKGIDPKSAVTTESNEAPKRVSTAEMQRRYDAAKSDSERKAITDELEKAAAENRLD